MTTMMTLAQAHALLPGSTLVGDAKTPIVRVHSDTRSLRTGDLFVALRGERFDAHQFLARAREAGAVAAIAESGLAEAGLPGLIVPDTLAALGRLAAAWRRGFELPFIAVTGSNGKTTVTQMIANVLRAWVDAQAFSTEGNFNNDIGVPLTLLRLRESHRAGVVELGMNHPGEIASLAAMAAPTVVLVNNAQREHQEFMASVEAVARENGTAIEALSPSGVAVFPADDAMAPIWQRLAGGRPVLTFALTGAADVTCEAEGTGDGWTMDLHTPAGSATLRLSMAGRHNLRNAMATAACALAAGCPLRSIVSGLESFKPVKGRSQLHRIARGDGAITLIDDSYNANPDSVRAAIDVLTELPGPRWLVLGDMGEVGDHGPAFHAEVGAYAAQRRIDVLWTVGSATEATAAAYAGQGASRHFATVADLVASLAQAPAAASVLVKGSRFMKTEQVVAALMAQADASGLSAKAGDAHAA
ncbi:MAG: UDP-N-acetylmuramoylalanyl-D-glutamyl-2,6-diaminopimelate--D-alanyl-D-alanine ligase [Rhizobacter sp.]|nr:UDP-N-acetylmuramoylalanyl-D-glutamyl-2,6-diaminopimelate--D-alanyl-D-alanine ligase [Rhizobacter sp.]